MKRSIFGLALGLAVSASVMAAGESPPLGAIIEQQQLVRRELVETPGSFPGLSSTERAEMLDRQSRLLTLLEGKTSTDELGEEERIEVFNSLEWIKSRLADAREERLICRRERMVGSQRITRVCRTVAERAAEREAAIDFHQRAARKPGRAN